MASISLGEYSQFFGLDSKRRVPITVNVTAGNPANATFHRVRLKVTIDSSEFEFASMVTANATVQFDISTAFIAVYDGYTYTASGVNPIPVAGYPSYTATMQAVDDYMVDGVVYENANPSQELTVKAYPGLLTDIDRLMGTRPSRYSRKPTTSPEVCFTGYKHLVPGATVEDLAPKDPSCELVTVPSGFADGYNIYGITAPQDGYEIRFINSLGVHENIFVTGFRSVEMPVQTDKYAIARQETLSQFSRTIARKSNDREKWSMSSGPLDEAWQQWYMHEFLMVEWAWIGIPSLAVSSSLSAWIPCHIIPEETVKAFDRTKPDLLKVEFIVEFDINGSPIGV